MEVDHMSVLLDGGFGGEGDSSSIVTSIIRCTLTPSLGTISQQDIRVLIHRDTKTGLEMSQLSGWFYYDTGSSILTAGVQFSGAPVHGAGLGVVFNYNSGHAYLAKPANNGVIRFANISNPENYLASLYTGYYNIFISDIT